MEKRYPQEDNPLPWVQKWLSEAGAENNVQTAPQETEISSYLIGSVRQDVSRDSFNGFQL